MRTTIKTGVYHSIAYVKVNSNPETIQSTDTATVTISSSIRADITRNTMVNGWRNPSAYTMTCYEAPNVPINWKATYQQYGTTLVRRATGTYKSGVPPTLPLPSSNIEQMVISKALEKLKQQQLNLALAIAERRKTADLLGQTALKLLHAYRLARSGQWGALARFLGFAKGHMFRSKIPSRKWLELQYGWMPLFSDIYGLALELSQKGRTEGLLFCVKASNSTDYSSVRKKAIAPGGTFGFDGTVQLKTKIDQKISLWYELDSAGLAAISRLGFTNPMALAWELIPFSFVLDWLLPIGRLLEAADATVGFIYKGGSHTAFSTWEEHGELLPTKTQDYTQTGSVPYQMSGKVMNRKRYETSPVPKLYIKNPFSTPHIVTSVALLRVLRKNR